MPEAGGRLWRDPQTHRTRPRARGQLRNLCTSDREAVWDRHSCLSTLGRSAPRTDRSVCPTLVLRFPNSTKLCLHAFSRFSRLARQRARQHRAAQTLRGRSRRPRPVQSASSTAQEYCKEAAAVREPLLSRVGSDVFSRSAGPQKCPAVCQLLYIRALIRRN